MHYLDMAMSLSYPHPDEPYQRTGVKLGDEQFALAPEWERSGPGLLVVGMGVEPGLSDVFARYAADELFGEITELGVRDGANLEVAGYDFGAHGSICRPRSRSAGCRDLERGPAWFTTSGSASPCGLQLPPERRPVDGERGHEEALADAALVQRWPPSGTALARSSSACSGPCTTPGFHRTQMCRRHSVSPAPAVAGVPAQPGLVGDKMSGLTCAGTWATGTSRDGVYGAPREVYLYHVVDNAWSMAEYGSQAVVWQTAVNPVVALELIDGRRSGAGVLGPEALPPRPFLDLLTDYGSPWACEERTPA